MDLKRYKSYDHQEKLSKGIHFTIDHNGVWYFHGEQSPGPMKRERLAKLFSDKALKIKDQRYFLETPYESYEVEVEDVPFIIVSMKECEGNLIYISNLNEEFKSDNKRKIFLKRPFFSDLSLPYIEIRDGLLARFHQDVRAELIERAFEQDPNANEEGVLYLNINGLDHPIAKWEE